MMFRENFMGFRQVRAWIEPQVPVPIPCFHPGLTRAFKAECFVSVFLSSRCKKHGKSGGDLVSKDSESPGHLCIVYPKTQS